VAALVRRIRGVVARKDIDARPARIFVTDIFMEDFLCCFSDLWDLIFRGRDGGSMC
jgi:hypothetical protein